MKKKIDKIDGTYSIIEPTQNSRKETTKTKDDTTIAIIVNKNNKNFTVNDTYTALAARYPEIKELNDDIGVTEQMSRIKNNETERIINKKIMKIIYNGNEEELLYNKMEKLKKLTNKTKWIAMSCGENFDGTRLRKIVESKFHDSNTQVMIHATNKKEKTMHKKKERNTYAIAVDGHGQSFRDVLIKIKENVNKANSNTIKGIRSTRDNKLLITLEKDKQKMKDIQSDIQVYAFLGTVETANHDRFQSKDSYKRLASVLFRAIRVLQVLFGNTWKTAFRTITTICAKFLHYFQRVAAALKIGTKTDYIIRKRKENNPVLTSPAKHKPRPKLKTRDINDSVKMDIRNSLYNMHKKKKRITIQNLNSELRTKEILSISIRTKVLEDSKKDTAHIRGMDKLCTVTEVREALEELVLGIGPHLKLSELRPFRNDMQAITVLTLNGHTGSKRPKVKFGPELRYADL
ncbi:hypothetical protein ABEB36_000016 [Hypothenemus hampei]|uniref:Uncharacterized protein n=1 Tax=Hypothenemus hampei TaxID=57062 RepID=A0ABD1FAH4_HYPHA